MPRPITSGVLLAIASAVSFGLTTPVVAWAGDDAGPLTTAALLYAGAAAAAFAMRLVRRSVGGALKRSDAARVVAIAIAGAAIAPACFAWGLSKAGATGGSLILNFEAVLTVLLAWLIYRESLGHRVVAAMLIMAAAGVLLVLDASIESSPQPWGIAAVAVATLAWSIDNTLTRPLAERDPLQVIAAKGLLGATLTGSIAIVRGEVTPQLATIAILLVCGATGYGLSLHLYLLAQRRIGAARTGSVFAVAPFIGAGVAWVLGDRDASILTAIAAVGFGVGVYLHASERHGHVHMHEPAEHEHPHRHDDGHHDHEHDPPFVGEHTHRHAHGRRAHSHEHAPDFHHDHTH